MQKLFKKLSNILNTILGNKYIVIAIIAGLCIMYLPTYDCIQSDADKRLEIYRRQLSGQLTEKEKALQKANHSIGVLESELLSRDELAKRAKQEAEEISSEFEEFKRKHNLIIRSKDRVIARLEQKIDNGSTDVVVGGESDVCLSEKIRECSISYKWQDIYGRFSLTDENIFDDKSSFSAKQIFKVYGEIYEQEDGSLQTRRLVLREVYQKPDGTYDIIPDAKAEIIESKFEYHNPPTINPEWQWTDLFRLRGIVTIGPELFPEPGDLRFGLGLSFFDWEGLGINTHVSFDFDDPKNIGHYLGISYTPRFFGLDLNFGITASVGTPFYNFFQEFSFKVDFLVYINN